MCGIVGICNSKRVEGKEVYQILKNLEYRGYDSSGIAVLNENLIESAKSSGELTQIKNEIEDLSGTIAIGHTRWATHGAPTTINAHPHSTDLLSIVHNGIIENYQEIKLELQSTGQIWKTQTDSEVILNYLNHKISTGATPLNAIFNLVEKIEGAFAIVVLFKDQPNKLYAIRKSAPLHIAKNKNKVMYISDTSALEGEGFFTTPLPDKSISQISIDESRLWDFSGKELKPKFSKATNHVRTVNNDQYEHQMLREINEQPKIFEKLINERINMSPLSIAEVNGVKGLNLGKIDNIHIVACGSAYHAGLLGKYYLEKYSNTLVTVELASEFRYSNRQLTPKSLLIAISQSGETADTIACVHLAKKSNCQIVSFCNNPESEIARLATKNIPLNCGVEISVASTKAFLSMLACLYFFTLGFGRSRGQIKKDALQQILSNLSTFPQKIEEVFKLGGLIKKVSQILSQAKTIFFIGRKANFPIALEGALKLKEISYIQAEGYAAGELKHGPIALISRGTPVIAIVSNDSVYKKTLSNIIEAKTRGAKIIAISANDSSDLDNICEEVISLPFQNEDLSPILATVVVQLIAYHTANYLGKEIDRPRNLAKSVTVE